MGKGNNIMVLDLETLHSADDCQDCGDDARQGACRSPTGQHRRIGWDNKLALGLSIGCYYDYCDQRIHWVDLYTLEDTIRDFVKAQPLLVSFNGIAFDFPLMRGILRQRADEEPALPPGTVPRPEPHPLNFLCDAFKILCATSYDLLAEIWKVDPGRKFERGLNSLDAISQANGLGAKALTGALAPRLWQQGRYAEVIDYCQGDVYKTKALFELVCAGQPIVRGDGQPIVLCNPFPEEALATVDTPEPSAFALGAALRDASWHRPGRRKEP